MTDFARTRSQFRIPNKIVYLDGNSLGPLPVAAERRATRVLTEEWGRQLIRGWNEAGWMTMPRTVGDRIGRLIGADPGSVTMGDTLSIKLYQALAAALSLRPDRCIILSDTGNFPTDLYMAEGLIRALDRGYRLKLVEPDAVFEAIDDEVAVLMLTEVDYRTGRLHDMRSLNDRAHTAGVVTVWDLAHSAGALPVDVGAAGVDFAVGCTYKYLNGGPGAPAFIYVSPDHANNAVPALSGWMGHAAPFAFDRAYRPAPGTERMRVGTPPVIALAILDAALGVWDYVLLADVRQRSIELSSLFISEVEARCPDLALASPRQAEHRGSQVSFRHPDGYAIMQALIGCGVIGDFRAPDVIRFGITPLYIDAPDILAAVDALEQIMSGRLWDNPSYRKRMAVT